MEIRECIEKVSLSDYEIPFILGEDKEGNILIKDLTKLNNILIAGSTSSGKTNLLKTFMYTVASTMHPSDIVFVCIDLKMTSEYDGYNKSKLLLRKVITDVESAITSLDWCIKEMNTRLESNYSKPSIVILIDEYTELMLNNSEAENLLVELASKGNKVGIHLVLSTSKPSEKVVTDRLKGVFKSRISFYLANANDSKQIIDVEGAEKLEDAGVGIMKLNGESEILQVKTPVTYPSDVDLLQERINHF